MKRIKLIFLVIILIICALAGIWFVQDNSALTGLAVFGFSAGPLPLGVWLVATFFVGVLLALFATSVPVARARRKNKRLEKELNRLKSSVPA